MVSLSLTRTYTEQFCLPLGTETPSLTWLTKGSTTGMWRLTETCAGNVLQKKIASLSLSVIIFTSIKSVCLISPQIHDDDSMWSGCCHQTLGNITQGEINRGKILVRWINNTNYYSWQPYIPLFWLLRLQSWWPVSSLSRATEKDQSWSSRPLWVHQPSLVLCFSQFFSPRRPPWADDAEDEFFSAVSNYTACVGNMRTRVS